MSSGSQEDESITIEILNLLRERLPFNISSIAFALTRIAVSPLIKKEIPAIDDSLNLFIKALQHNDLDSIEKALTGLYITLHNARTHYSEEEKRILNSWGGYLCYPGGLSPIILARSFIKEDAITADLGAGNGLQGLLLQHIYPHKKTIQIEISKEMIRIGKLYQEALAIGIDKIEWVNDDIMNATFEEADLIYIYRPVRPVEGANLYREIAKRLSEVNKDITVFSVADCLSPYFKDNFFILYDNGHLKVFVNYKVSSSVYRLLTEDLPFL